MPVVQTLHNYRLVCLGGLLRRDGRPCEDCVGTSTSGSASLMLATTAIPLRRTMEEGWRKHAAPFQTRKFALQYEATR